MHLTRFAAAAAAAPVLTLGIAVPAHAIHAADEDPCTQRLVAAHEGNRHDADSDTIESQQAAFAVGANIADSDIWRTKDGYLVEHHANSLSGSTNGTGNITDSTWDYVHSLRTRPHNELVPLLDWSLELAEAQDPGRYVQFETKWSMNGEPALQQLADDIAAHNMVDHTILYSAYLPQLQKLEEINPALVTILKAVHPPTLDKLAGLDGTMLKNRYLTPETVAIYHDAGFIVVRHVMKETPGTWRHFVKSNADGLMTNEPKLVVQWCKQL